MLARAIAIARQRACTGRDDDAPAGRHEHMHAQDARPLDEGREQAHAASHGCFAFGTGDAWMDQQLVNDRSFVDSVSVLLDVIRRFRRFPGLTPNMDLSLSCCVSFLIGL